MDLQSWVGPEQGLTDLMRATQKTLEIIGCGEREKLIFFEQLIHELTFLHQKHRKFACGIERRTPYFPLVFEKVLLAPGFHRSSTPQPDPPMEEQRPTFGPSITPAV